MTRKQQLDFFRKPCSQIQWRDLPRKQQEETRFLLCRLFAARLDLACSSQNENTFNKTAVAEVQHHQKETRHAREN